MCGKLRKNNAITLVALVITIIILLILAGISIVTLTGSGLFEKAILAKQKSENAQELENEILSNYEMEIDKHYRGTGDKIAEGDYKKLEDVTRIFFNNNVLNLKERTRVFSTGTQTTTDLNKLISTVTIPTEIIESGIISSGNVFLYLTASNSSMSLSPSSDGFMYIMYNNTKYMLRENNNFIEQKIQLIEGINQFEVYMGWNNYHSNAYMNFNLKEKYTCYEGNMVEKKYATGTMTQTNLDKVVGTETINREAKYFTATVTSNNINVDPLEDAFMYILYNGNRYYFYENKEFKTVSVPIVDNVDTYEVHMGWNNYHSNAYENITLSVIFGNDTEVKDLINYINSLNKVLGYY